MNSTQSAASGSAIDETQNRFLSMLVAQMKNQDPLNPLDNAQVTSQMAQLSTVQGISDLNKSMQSLLDSFGTAQMSQAANLIGHAVLMPGNAVSPDAGRNVIGVNLPNSVDSLVVTVRDSLGQPVRTLNLGSQSYGDQLFSWDGLKDDGTAAASGAYQFSIDAVQGGKAVEATALSVGQVFGVLREGANVQLNVDGLGAVNYTDVRQIL
jgi:flagellar basal-body rod modification protein FlgD